MPDRAELQFLGWDAPAVPAAAQRLLERAAAEGRGADLGDLIVAVPGARAGRLLLQHLRQAAPARDWIPPRVLTQGKLIDELAIVDVPLADRTTRTLAWERALREVLGGGASRLLERPPELADRPSWWRLAERVRSLHSELAVEGLEFGDLAHGARAEDVPARERARWEALGEVQERWRALLGEVGLADPHDARNAALDSGRARRGARVALLGVVDAPGLLRLALEALDAPPLALVVAPKSERAGFDAFGLLVAEYWRARQLSLPLDRWHVVTGPRDQAELAAQLIAESPAQRADEITIGVADEEVVPFLERRFAEDGVRARAAAGRPLERSAPARLIAALARWLDCRSARDAAALVRHPDLDAHLVRALELDAAALLDEVRARHLVHKIGGTEPEDAPPEGMAQDRRARLDALIAELERLAGELALDRPLQLERAAGALREFLVAIYAGADLAGEAPHAEAEPARRELREALAAIGDAVAELEGAPPGVGERARPSQALDLVLRALRGRAVPPPPELSGEPTVELLGWLELVLDDAPHLVVTGFADGRVPEGLGADPFLPDGLRAALGLEDDAQRLARDAYAAAALLASRDAHFVSARRTRDGDPLFPSRLAFHAPDVEAPRRVLHATDPASVAAPSRMETTPNYDRPDLSRYPAPDVFAVTSFKAYADSPFLYGLERMLHFEPVDDGARELDARGFGNLVHDALEALEDGELARSVDVERIEGALLARLERGVLRRYGRRPLPAVQMQASQARLRLQKFAAWQAARVADGWIVRHSEWTPSAYRDGRLAGSNHRTGTALLPSTEPRAWITGKVDRLEQHADGRWAILDYKTSKKPLDPEKARKRPSKKAADAGARAEWKDLQLPLYCLLAREVVGDALDGDSPHVPLVGYVNLGPGRTDLRLKAWPRAELREAIEAAAETVAKIRAGELSELGRTYRPEPLVAELAGIGLIEAPETPAEEDGEEDR